MADSIESRKITGIITMTPLQERLFTSVQLQLKT
jgi:hypothetical protein